MMPGNGSFPDAEGLAAEKGKLDPVTGNRLTTLRCGYLVGPLLRDHRPARGSWGRRCAGDESRAAKQGEILIPNNAKAKRAIPHASSLQEDRRCQHVRHSRHSGSSSDPLSHIRRIQDDRVRLVSADDGDVRSEQAEGLLAGLTDGKIRREVVGECLLDPSDGALQHGVAGEERADAHRNQDSHNGVLAAPPNEIADGNSKEHGCAAVERPGPVLVQFPLVPLTCARAVVHSQPAVRRLCGNYAR